MENYTEQEYQDLKAEYLGQIRERVNALYPTVGRGRQKRTLWTNVVAFQLYVDLGSNSRAVAEYLSLPMTSVNYKIRDLADHIGQPLLGAGGKRRTPTIWGRLIMELQPPEHVIRAMARRAMEADVPHKWSRSMISLEYYKYRHEPL